MELDLSALAKEDELLFIFRALTQEQQMTLLGMLRGVYGDRPPVHGIEAEAPSNTVH